MQHGYPAGRLAVGFGGWFVLAIAVVVRLRVSQTLGDVMLYIRVVFGRARLDALRLAIARHREHEGKPADDRGQDQPVAQFHGPTPAAPSEHVLFSARSSCQKADPDERQKMASPADGNHRALSCNPRRWTCVSRGVGRFGPWCWRRWRGWSRRRRGHRIFPAASSAWWL